MRMSAWGWYLDAWHNYAEFEGRSSRPAYWYFALVHLIISFMCLFLDVAFFRWPYPFLMTLYGLAAVIPGLSLSVRRLHDRDISGWLILISVVPVLGAFILLYQFAQDSKPGDNRYDPNPKNDLADLSSYQDALADIDKDLRNKRTAIEARRSAAVDKHTEALAHYEKLLGKLKAQEDLPEEPNEDTLLDDRLSPRAAQAKVDGARAGAANRPEPNQEHPPPEERELQAEYQAELSGLRQQFAPELETLYIAGRTAMEKLTRLDEEWENKSAKLLDDAGNEAEVKKEHALRRSAAVDTHTEALAHYEKWLGKLKATENDIRWHYNQAVQAFRTANVKARCDHKVPRCFRNPPDDLDLHFLKFVTLGLDKKISRA